MTRPQWPLAAILLSGLSAAALSQTTPVIPDAGSLLRETERQQRQLPKPGPQAIPAAPASAAQAGVRIHVKAFKLSGHSLIAESELQAVLAPWVGKESSFAELQSAANALTEHYRRHGWFVRVQLPAQDVNDGIITLNILEGRLGAVRIDDGGKALRIDRNFVSESMTERQKPGDPLNLDALERSSNILNDTPGVTVATVLAPGDKPGDTDAMVKVADKPPLTGSAQIDNQGARSTGSDKLSLGGTLDNPSGKGDQIALNGNASRGSTYLKLSYSLPVGRDGLRVGGNVSQMNYRLLGDFAKSDTRGDATTWGINAYYPLQRAATANTGLSLAYDNKDYNVKHNLDAAPGKKANIVIASLTGDLLDGFGAGGMTLWGINLTAGNIDLDGNAKNAFADAKGPDTAGSFYKLGYSLARLQRLDGKTTLWASFNGQTAGKNLDASEQMGLGGPAGVRAYPVMESTGDDGWLATLELRYSLSPELQLTGFYDHGQMRVRHDYDYDTTGALRNGTLKGWGIGLNYTLAGNYALRASWARRLGDNPFADANTGNDQDGSKDLNRFWLTAMKFF
jgi:hemolysin activation/secretion protein